MNKSTTQKHSSQQLAEDKIKLKNLPKIENITKAETLSGALLQEEGKCVSDPRTVT